MTESKDRPLPAPSLIILFIDDAPPAEDADLVLDGVDEIGNEGQHDEQHDDYYRDGDVFLDHCGGLVDGWSGARGSLESDWKGAGVFGERLKA